jgi:hypothetical protein
MQQFHISRIIIACVGLSFTILSLKSFSQLNESIFNVNESPNASKVLDVSSTTKGLLIVTRY